MSGDLTVKAQPVARAQGIKLWGDWGHGFYRLKIQVTFTVTADLEKSLPIVGIQGDLVLNGQRKTSIVAGRLVPSGGSNHFRIRGLGKNYSLHLHADLAARQIEEIERVRAGGPLYMTMNLWGSGHTSEGPYEAEYSESDHHIEQSEWVKVLEQMKWGKFILVEVLVPDPVELPESAKAVARLKEAQAALRDGRYEDVVAICRKVLEARLADLGLKVEDYHKTIYELLSQGKKLTKEQRQFLIFRSVHLMTHLGHHEVEVEDNDFLGGAKGVSWTREDAVAALGMTAVVVRQAQNAPVSSSKAEK